MAFLKDQIHEILKVLQDGDPKKEVSVWTTSMVLSGVPFYVGHMPYALGLRSAADIIFVGVDTIEAISTARDVNKVQENKAQSEKNYGG